MAKSKAAEGPKDPGDQVSAGEQTAAGKPQDPEELRAESARRAFDYLNKAEEIDKRRAGQFCYVPDDYRDWEFVRCGHRSSDYARALYHDLCRKGAYPAPPQVRMVGAQEDGEDTLIVMFSPEAWGLHQRRRHAAAQQASEALGSSFAAHVGGIQGRGYQAEVLDYQDGQIEAGEFERRFQPGAQSGRKNVG